MVGIFGYYNLENQNKNFDLFLSKIKDEKYTKTKEILNHSCLLGELNVKKYKIKNNVKTKNENKISIVTCGEIFNSDISNLEEKILELYKKNQLHKLKNLNGTFLAAIYDDEKKKLTIVNDRYGSIKMFYFWDEKQFVFAPKVKPLSYLNKKLRKDAITEFFLYGHLIGDKTFFEKIYQIPYGSILEIYPDSFKITKYWDYKYNGKYHSKSKEELIDELGAIIQKAVERRIKKDENLFIPLSGGLDSRSILAASLKCVSKERISTFTFGEKGSYDFEIGKKVAKKAGVKNIILDSKKKDFEKQYNIWVRSNSGLIDATPYFPVEGYVGIQNYTNKIFIGYMAGSITGYQVTSDMINKTVTNEQDFDLVKRDLFKFFSLNNPRLVKKLFNQSYLNGFNLKDSFDESFDELEKTNIKNVADFYAIWDHKHRRDKYVMNATVKFRENLYNILPFLDNDIIDFWLKVPPKYRAKQQLYKDTLLAKYPELSKYPIKNHFGMKLNTNKFLLFIHFKFYYLKLNINKVFTKIFEKGLFQDKDKNYIDYNDFLRNNEEYQNLIRKLIDKIEKREYFNKDYIENLWDAHINKTKNYASLFGLLATFELFLEEFVDKKQ